MKLGETDSKVQEKLTSAVDALVAKYLDGYPIYTLDQSDLKQAVAGRLLKGIAVKNDSLFVTFGV